MCEDACCKVAHLHLWAVQQFANVVQEPLDHQLSVQLSHLRYVVLCKGEEGNDDISCSFCQYSVLNTQTHQQAEDLLLNGGLIGEGLQRGAGEA